MELFASKASAQTRADGLYAARFRETANHDTIEVPYGSSTAHAHLGARMPAPDAHALFSIDNANREYFYVLVYRRHGCAEDTVLLVGGVGAATAGASRGNGECRYDFRVTRAQADRIATTAGIAREDRSPIGDRVTARFASASTTFAPGTPMEIRVRFENPAGAPAVQREAGCCRFSLVVHHDSAPAQTLECGAMACPVGYAPLAGGATAEDSVDVGRWANIRAPGHYRVECTYRTNFTAAGVVPFDAPSFLGRLWEREFTGVVEFDVR